MRKSHRLTRAALGALLLLGACAPGLPSSIERPEPTRAAPAEPTEPAPPPGAPPIATTASPAAGSSHDAMATGTSSSEARAVLPASAAPAPPSTVSPSPPPPIAVSDRRMARAVAARPAGTEVGYLLVDLESGATLAELNPDRPLIPGSTTKLATALVALDVLGPGHRYRTALLTRGRVREGVLEGDLILKGDGDPALDVADLLELAVRLESSGVRRVEGRFLIDDTALPRLPAIEPSQPPEAAYNSSVGALSLAFNRVRVRWRGGDPETVPPLAEAHFERAPAAQLPPGGVELGQSGAGAVLWRVAARDRWREFAVPVKDPGRHAGHVFRWLAEAQGIELPLPQRGATPPGAIRVAVHESAPLRHLLRDMLTYSNNVMAELIGLSAAARLGDVSAGLDAAGRLMLGHLARIMPEVDWRPAALGNHSGLDAAARLTPRQLVALLRYGWDQEALPALLPAGGWLGTLARRFDGRGQTLRVWAKTGTLNYGGALAGYVLPQHGRPAAFVVMVSDIGSRLAYDLLDRPGAAAEAAARAWNARARALQDDLVEGWLEPLSTS